MAAAPHELDTLVDEPDSVEVEAEGEIGVEPSLGELFAGRYQIERFIGRGSMGTVYAVQDQVIGELVALKLLALPRSNSIERFGREVRLARRVTHRNTARVFDLAEVDGTHFITMELVDGESLRVRLAREHRLPPAEVATLGHQIAAGLQAAHDVGVLHRDLKPGNILLDADDRAVITDFGVAISLVEMTNQTIERPALAGTPMYMAPEQIIGAPLDSRSDLYSLGVMLYELLTGQPPFSGGNRVEVAMARLSAPPPDPRDRAQVPAGLAELVQRCMAREPRDRPANAGIIARALTALEGPAVSRPDTTQPRERATSSITEAFALTSPGERTLAVMPFRYRGPAEDAYLADAITDELVDLLAMTRGLRVSSSGAAEVFRSERDARAVGRALGVDAIVDGTVQRRGGGLRIVARLIDVATGFQQWSDRFDGELGDVFELQDRMAKRITEALRVELSLPGLAQGVDAEAVQLYLLGRRCSREPDLSGRGLEQAVQWYDRALERAPAFSVALAARAEAAVRGWFLASREAGPAWERRAREALAQAEHAAEHLAETHLAAARLAVGDAEFVPAARHLVVALELAPTYAAAHEYLGQLQCDAGRSREGVKHILLAHELDPNLNLGLLAVLRHHGLRGDHAAFEERLARLRLTPSVPGVAVDLFEFRVALWHGDRDRAAAVDWHHASSKKVMLMKSTLDPTVDPRALAERFDAVTGSMANPRRRVAWRQFAVEALLYRGAADLGLAQLAKADAEGVLLDADWLETCPLLMPLASRDELATVRANVRARADAIWRTAREAAR